MANPLDRTLDKTGRLDDETIRVLESVLCDIHPRSTQRSYVGDAELVPGLRIRSDHPSMHRLVYPGGSTGHTQARSLRLLPGRPGALHREDWYRSRRESRRPMRSPLHIPLGRKEPTGLEFRSISMPTVLLKQLFPGTFC